MKTLGQAFTETSAETLAEFRKLVRQRRATPHFRTDPVPEPVIDTALSIARQAPSGYNLQPWRFVVVRDSYQRGRLRKAALDQEKITEAPLVIACFAEHDGWRRHMKAIIEMRTELTGEEPEDAGAMESSAAGFIESLTLPVWLNRQAMIAFTYLMLAFEAQGWDTAPMEGFDAEKMRKVLALPEATEVIALLAVGRARDPDTPYPGRLDVDQLAFRENFDEPYVSGASTA